MKRPDLSKFHEFTHAHAKNIRIGAAVGVIVMVEVAFAIGYLDYTRTGTFPVLSKIYDKLNPYLRRFNQIPRFTKNALFITQPVHSFSGTVDRITDTGFRITNTLEYDPGSIGGNDPEPSPYMRSVSYTVTTTPRTQWVANIPTVPYIFTHQTDTTETAEQTTDPGEMTPNSQLSAGDYVTVQTESDLRTLPNPAFTAASVSLPSVANSTSGTIDSISDDIIKITGTVPAPDDQTKPYSAQTMEYTLTVTSNTEIYTYIVTDPTGNKSITPRRLSIEDLKPGDNIDIHTDFDLRDAKEGNALVIVKI